MDQVVQVNGPSSRRTPLERNSRKWRHCVIVAADQIFQHYSPATWGPHYRGAQGSWTVREKRTASGWDRKNSNVKQRMRQIKVDIHLLLPRLLPKSSPHSPLCTVHSCCWRNHSGPSIALERGRRNRCVCSWHMRYEAKMSFHTVVSYLLTTTEAAVAII